MTTLLLRLAAPLQSWGTSSRFVRRNTDRSPSKSGIVGLLAAAKGLRRTDPLEDLLELRVGVRIDQPGRLERDFQTAHSRDSGASMPLSYRFYLADAVFVVAVQGDGSLLEGVRDALLHPVYPLYLGRRSCPPAGPLIPRLRDGEVAEVLAAEPWCASERVRRACRMPDVSLATIVDCAAGTMGAELVRDEPISFDPRRREYGWRSVLHNTVTLPNPSYDHAGPSQLADLYDPFAALERLG